jgi:hypothetical protein
MGRQQVQDQRQELPEPPGRAKSLLLHSCCAPCAGGILELLAETELAVTVFFCNPNIHPPEEYRRRMLEQQRFAEQLGVPFVEAAYEPDVWFEAVAGLEDEPERGRRCSVCFELRLAATARYAARHGFEAFATTLGISRWKDLEQVNAAGQAAARKHPEVLFWPHNWRKKGGSQRMVEVARRAGFYRQEYCGCIFSLRDGNRWRARQGRPPVERDLGEWADFLES